MAGKQTNQERPEQKKSHPGTSERSGSQSAQRGTYGQDMPRGSGRKIDESKRSDDKEHEDVNRDKRRSSSERERKGSH